MRKFQNLSIRRIVLSTFTILFVVLTISLLSKIDGSLNKKIFFNNIYQNEQNLLLNSSRGRLNTDCTIDNINRYRLEQDHPCTLQIIRREYLYPPAKEYVPYYLDNVVQRDPSKGQANEILKRFGYKKGGFFIECGALDGEYLSNTLYMERFFNWSGILIEVDNRPLSTLFYRRRKSYVLPVCLSLEPYATKVNFTQIYAQGSIQANRSNEQNTRERLLTSSRSVLPMPSNTVEVQCFSLYSILLALNRTRVDYLSLDIEGHELKVLNTIPWQYIDIKVISVEWDLVGLQDIIDFLTPKGYHIFGFSSSSTAVDAFFEKK